MATFIFGGETNETPDSIKRKRDIARALLGASAPRNVGEGISALGDGIVAAVLNSRADKAENAGLASADAAWANAFGGGTAQPTPGTMGGSMPEVTDTGEIPVKPIDMTGNEVFSSFMDTVKAGGVTNPNALAAIAATGQRESGFDPKNAVRTWSDPSESGQAGRAGGIMSWRGPRYEALAATGDLSPAGQAKFFLGENPQLIQRLNAAKTPEEAQRLMNEAWKFAGWNRPGGEAAARFKAANAFLPQFAGQQGDAAQAIEAIAPTGDVSLTDEVADFRNSPEFLKAYPGGYNKQPLSDQQFNDRFGDTALPAEMPKDRGALVSALMANQSGGQTQMVTPELSTEFAGSAQLQGAMANPRAGIVQALMGGQPATEQQIAQARATGTQQQTGQGALGLDPRILDALSNPFLSDGRKAVLKAMIDQQMGQQQAEREMRLKQADPAYQLGLEKSRLELEALRNPKVDPMKIGQGETVLDPATGRVIFKADPKPEAKPSAVQEYEYAKTQGFPGTFQDWEASKKGGMSLQVDPATGAVTFQQGGNIKPMTEGQSKDAVFATRAEGALTELEKNSEALLSMGDTLAGSVPVVGNRLVSSEFQQAQQAGREFLQAILRKDTGAAITKEETAEYGEVYLPRPGDSPETLKQKAASRRRALEAIKAGMPPQAILAQEKALANTNAATGDVLMPDGMDPADWEFLTPEERRLFAK